MESNPIRPEELLPLEEYARRREGIRAEIIALKTLRRVEVGPWVSVVFENRATVLFQIQEMLRVEHIREPEKIQHEIDTFAELLPGEGELSGTLFIEIPDDEQRREALKALGGIEGHTRLKIGDRVVPARDKRPIDPIFARPGQATCVYYLAFPFSNGAKKMLVAGMEPVWLEIDHPRYSHATKLGAQQRRSLAEDLGGC